MLRSDIVTVGSSVRLDLAPRGGDSQKVGPQGMRTILLPPLEYLNEMALQIRHVPMR